MTDTVNRQRQRLMDALKRGPISVDQARNDLRIPNPGHRVFELRHSLGVDIATLTAHRKDEDGTQRKISLYVLVADNKAQEAAHA